MSEKHTIGDDHPPHGGLVAQPIGLVPKLRQAIVEWAGVTFGWTETSNTLISLLADFDRIVAAEQAPTPPVPRLLPDPLHFSKYDGEIMCGDAGRWTSDKELFRCAGLAACAGCIVSLAIADRREEDPG